MCRQILVPPSLKLEPTEKIILTVVQTLSLSQVVYDK